MKHTPGPWVVRNSTSGAKIYSEEGQLLAKVIYEVGPFESNNALLFAAAPILLKALEDTLENMEWGTPIPNGWLEAISLATGQPFEEVLKKWAS